MKRPIELQTGDIYHACNKSIYGYVIFNTPEEYERMRQLAGYYQWDMPISFTHFKDDVLPQHRDLACALETKRPARIQKRVDIIAYCFMPTHIHFVLRQLCGHGIAAFMKDIQSGYSQFFNRRHNRRGPLWQGRFGNGNHLDSPEKLLEKVAYVHNNPVKDLGYASPGDWPYSSLTSPLPGCGEVYGPKFNDDVQK